MKIFSEVLKIFEISKKIDVQFFFQAARPGLSCLGILVLFTGLP